MANISLEFKNIGHALATFWKATLAKLPAVEAGVEKAISDKALVEGISDVAAGAIGGAPAVVATNAVEDAAIALLGSVDAALKSGGDAATSKLLDAGLDQTAIDKVKAVVNQSQGVYTLVSSQIAATKK